MKRLILFIFSFAFTVSYSQNQTILHVNVSDMVYNHSRNKLFAIIKGTDPQYGNSLIQINCNTKQIEKSLFVGSDPNLIEITSDNQYLYIALSGSPKIVKVNIETFTIDLQFPIGPIGGSINIYAEDIETIPNNSNLLAVSRKDGNYVQDVVIFNNGVINSNSVLSRDLEATEIECDNTGETLFGFNGSDTGFDFGRMQISSTGLTLKDKFKGVLSDFITEMTYVNNLLYTNKGSIVNPNLSIPFREGTFSGVENPSKLALNITEKESYFGTFDYWSETFRVRRYNIDTYTLKDIKEFDLIFPNTMSDPELSEFICYGKDKFVVSASESYFSDDNENYIIFIDNIYTLSTSNPNEFNPNKILVYPNPVAELLTIELETNNKNSIIEIVNTLGQTFYSEKTQGVYKTNIDVSKYSSGLYIVKISDGLKEFTKHLVIE